MEETPQEPSKKEQKSEPVKILKCNRVDQVAKIVFIFVISKIKAFLIIFAII